MKPKQGQPRTAMIPPPSSDRPPDRVSLESVVDMESFAFLRELGHQLSQPATTIRGLLELALVTGRTVEDYRQAAQQVLEPAERLAKLVRLLRELAEAGTTGEGGGPSPLSRIVEEVAEDLRPLAQSRGVELILERQDNIRVPADELLAKEVVHRLVLSALLRSTGWGAIRISLGSSQQEAQLVVSNERPPRGGEPKRRSRSAPGGHESESTLEDRLEWAIAKLRINSMGGSVSVEHSPGHWCRVCARFPLASPKNS